MTDYTIPTPDTDGKLPDDGIDSLAQQFRDAPDISRGETAIAQRANPECNLAHIVDQAVAYGISPAWADARDASPAPDGATPSASGPAPGIGI